MCEGHSHTNGCDGAMRACIPSDGDAAPSFMLPSAPSYHHIPSDGDAMMEWGSLVFWMRGVGIGYRVFRDEGGDGDWISIFFMRGGGDDFVPYEG